MEQIQNLHFNTYTVLPFILKLILFKSSQKRVIDVRSISISSSVHLLLYGNKNTLWLQCGRK